MRLASLWLFPILCLPWGPVVKVCRNRIKLQWFPSPQQCMGCAKPQMVFLCFSNLQSFQWFLCIFSLMNSCKLLAAQTPLNSTKHCSELFFDLYLLFGNTTPPTQYLGVVWAVEEFNWQNYIPETNIRDATVPFFVYLGVLTTTPQVELLMGKAPMCLKDLHEMRSPEDTDIQPSAQGLKNFAFICVTQWDTQQRFGCSVRRNMKVGRLAYSKRKGKLWEENEWLWKELVKTYAQR